MAYLAIFRARLRVLLRYRAAAWAGVGTQLFFGIVLIATRKAFYEHSTAVPPLPFAKMVTYSWLVQALFAMSPFTANPDPEVRKQLLDGSVAYELCRPLDLHTLWLVRNAANRLAPTLLRSGPIFALGILFFGMEPPPSALALGSFLLAICGALALIAAWCALICTSLLWTLSGDGLARTGPFLVSLLSGQLVPLALYPDWLQPALKFLPFSGMLDAPFSLYLGTVPPSGVVGVLAHQLAWTLCFVLLGRFLLARGLKRLVVQGG